jgi:hypothetical protein
MAGGKSAATCRVAHEHVASLTTMSATAPRERDLMQRGDLAKLCAAKHEADREEAVDGFKRFLAPRAAGVRLAMKRAARDGRSSCNGVVKGITQDVAATINAVRALGCGTVEACVRDALGLGADIDVVCQFWELDRDFDRYDRDARPQWGCCCGDRVWERILGKKTSEISMALRW